MAHIQTSSEYPRGGEPDGAWKCLRLAVRADRRAAQATDPDMRSAFLSMKELWLDLAREIDRRQ